MTQGGLACSETQKSPIRIIGEAGHCTQETPGQGETNRLAHGSVPSSFWAQGQVRGVPLHLLTGGDGESRAKKASRTGRGLSKFVWPCGYLLNRAATGLMFVLFCFVFRVSCSPHNLQV